MTLSLIAAVADNGVIGRDNKLPWYLPQDLRYFRAVTMGKPVVMGRRTWESMNRPLPGRTNIVITRQAGYEADGAKVVADLDSAIALAETVAAAEGVDEVMVIGGAEIYRMALPRADRLYLTEVHTEVTGDVCFPAWDRSLWTEVSRQDEPPRDSDSPGYSFVVYERAG